MIKNLTYEQYITLPLDERDYYDRVIKYSELFKEPFNHYLMTEFVDMTFGEVKDIQYLFEQSNHEGIELWVQERIKQPLAKIRIRQLWQQLAWVAAQVDMINKLEIEKLSYTPEDTEERADLTRFNKFGNYPQFVSIAKDLNYTIEQVKSMKYSEAFMHLLYMHDCNEYQKDLNRILSAKHRNK